MITGKTLARRHPRMRVTRYSRVPEIKRRGAAYWVARSSRAMTSGELPAHLRHQRVGHLEIRVDVLHVVVLVEQVDQFQQFLAGDVVDRDGVLRLPGQRRLARLAEFCFQ